MTATKLQKYCIENLEDDWRFNLQLKLPVIWSLRLAWSALPYVFDWNTMPLWHYSLPQLSLSVSNHDKFISIIFDELLISLDFTTRLVNPPRSDSVTWSISAYFQKSQISINSTSMCTESSGEYYWQYEYCRLLSISVIAYIGRKRLFLTTC